MSSAALFMLLVIMVGAGICFSASLCALEARSRRRFQDQLDRKMPGAGRWLP